LVCKETVKQEHRTSLR